MMKKGFTLVELLVVVGLMGLLGSIAIGGYSAITRGMADRGALDAAKSIADAALQRAQIDRQRTYLYLFNEVSKLDSEMNAGVAQGVAIAVRSCGRITAVPEGNFFCDEFADLASAYATLEDEGEEKSESEKQLGASTIRLYNIGSGEFCNVEEGVFLAGPITDVDIESGAAKNFYFHGFKKQSGAANFEVGQMYGQEFSITRLPPGYLFSDQVSLSSATDLGQKLVQRLVINPTDTVSPSITVYLRRPNGNFESIGATTEAKDGKE